MCVTPFLSPKVLNAKQENSMHHSSIIKYDSTEYRARTYRAAYKASILLCGRCQVRGILVHFFLHLPPVDLAGYGSSVGIIPGGKVRLGTELSTLLGNAVPHDATSLTKCRPTLVSSSGVGKLSFIFSSQDRTASSEPIMILCHALLKSKTNQIY